MMPTENELKFVLNLDCEQQFVETVSKKYRIAQGYLLSSKGNSLRLRKSEIGKVFSVMNTFIFHPQVKSDKNYSMTYKHSVNNRVVEIESKLDERDFNDIWPSCMNKVYKIRHIVKDDAKQIWEIDFFKAHNNDTYFAMAEIELPERATAPVLIPKFIKNNLLFKVPLTDCRFASKLLGDVRYAIDLHESLGKKDV